MEGEGATQASGPLFPEPHLSWHCSLQACGSPNTLSCQCLHAPSDEETVARDRVITQGWPTRQSGAGPVACVMVSVKEQERAERLGEGDMHSPGSQGVFSLKGL